MSHELPSTNTSTDETKPDPANYDLGVAAQEQVLRQQLRDGRANIDRVARQHGMERVGYDGKLSPFGLSDENNKSTTILHQSDAPSGLTENGEITVQELYDGRIEDIERAEKAAKDHYAENKDQIAENSEIEYDAHKKANEKLQKDGKAFPRTEDVKEARYQSEQAEQARSGKIEELRTIRTESGKATKEAQAALDEAIRVGIEADRELSKLAA